MVTTAYIQWHKYAVGNKPPNPALELTLGLQYYSTYTYAGR